MKKLNLEEIKNSIISEIDLMKLITKFPHEYIDNENIVNAIQSQSNISKYYNEELRIISLSLNTHKYYINKYCDFSYSHYNLLRKNALNEIIKYKSRKIIKKSDINQELKNLKIYNFALIKIIYDLKSCLKNISYKTSDKKIINEVDSKIKNISKLLNYNSDLYEK